MSVEFRNLKGTQDYMPKEQKIRQGIIKKLQETFEIYGFQPIDTPIISYFDVLSSKYAGGSEILKEVYKLRDQGERELGLRYDLTVPFAKLIGMNPEIKLPFKRYEIGKVYRDGPVKLGRNREFIQCDVDVVGIKSVMAEAELINMAVEIYEMLGLEVFIVYNNRKLLSGIIAFVGIDMEYSSNVILILDKLEKIGEDAVKSELLEIGIDIKKIEFLFESMKRNPIEMMSSLKEKSMNEQIQQGITEINELNSYFEVLNIVDKVRFTPSLARGLEIYTGTVWEVFLTDGSITSSIGAGGRYDEIIGAFLGNGVVYPAVGMTFGLDVIYEALKIKGSITEKPPVDLYIIPIGTQIAAMRIIKDLRKNGVKVDIEMEGRRLKKSLDYANKLKIPYVLIVGENEIISGKLKIKNMETGDEYETEFDDVAEYVKNIVNKDK